MTEPGGADSPLRVAVDCSLLSATHGGLGRHLRALLPRMMNNGGAGVDWYLYARSLAAYANLPAGGHRRWDGLPDNFGRILAPALSLPHWVRRDRPQVLWAPAHRLPLWLPAATAGVVTIHDLAWARAPATLRRTTRFLDRTLMGRSVKRAQCVIAVSAATATDIAALWPGSAARTRVIHGAAEVLPAPAALATCSPGLKPGAYFLFVGTPEPRKNLPRLLEGYAMAARALADFPPLVLVGGHGWGDENLRELITGWQLADRVHLLGPVPDTTLSTLYANALCLVMPSLYEGFGLPIVEALQYGLPVLISANSSLPEVAGPAGLLVDPLSPESIAGGLQRMVRDPALYAELAAAARQQATLYSWDRAAVETLTVLREAAAIAARRSTSSRN